MFCLAASPAGLSGLLTEYSFQPVGQLIRCPTTLVATDVPHEHFLSCRQNWRQLLRYMQAYRPVQHF